MEHGGRLFLIITEMRNNLNLIFLLNAQNSPSAKRVNPQFCFSGYNNPSSEGSTIKIVDKLHEVKDSSKVISKSPKLSDYYSGKFEVVQFNFN